MDKLETTAQQLEQQTEQKEETASDNLNNNKVDTKIEPETSGNFVYISLCSCSINCCIS